MERRQQTLFIAKLSSNIKVGFHTVTAVHPPHPPTGTQLQLEKLYYGYGALYETLSKKTNNNQTQF